MAEPPEAPVRPTLRVLRAEVPAWLVAAGVREDGSGDDFYSALERQAKAARARYNADHDRPLTTSTYTGHLLPNADDRDRWELEAATRFALRLYIAVRERMVPRVRTAGRLR